MGQCPGMSPERAAYALAVDTSRQFSFSTASGLGSKVPLLFLVAVVACTACGSSESSEGAAPPPDPVALLAEHPVLPESVFTGGGREQVEWSRQPGGGPVDLRSCRDGDAAFRAWSENGIEGGIPSVTHVVCVLASEDAAAGTYASQSLPELAGEDWPNFEPNSQAETTPSEVDSLVLAADEWELGCGAGDPNEACSVWIFRARYGRVLTDVKYFSSPGEIRFAQMRDLVASIVPALSP
jgi:hypothetical protein